MHSFITKCPLGAEPFLSEELQELGVNSEITELHGALQFKASLQKAYTIGMGSRIASTLLLELKRFEVENADALYNQVMQIDWHAHFGPKDTFLVETTGKHPAFRNTKFASLKIKDAIVDQFRKQFDIRPSVDKDHPDVRVSAHLSNHGSKNECSILLHLFSKPLFQRGARASEHIHTKGAQAPLKENLAATLLHIADWKKKAQLGVPFFDPMCGSGTLLIEAAMIASNTAPGLQRKRNDGASYKALNGWKGHKPKLWQQIESQAESEIVDLEEKYPKGLIFGTDASSEAIHTTKSLIRKSSFSNVIKTKRQDLENIQPPKRNEQMRSSNSPQGLIITNPPYGERLGNPFELIPLYQQLGNIFRNHFLGWDAWILSGSKTLTKNVGLSAHSKVKLSNGPIECQFLHFPIADTQPKKQQGPHWERGEKKTETIENPFANKLKKNLKRYKKLAGQKGINTFRIYNRDIPEYSFAVDLYDEQVHIQAFLNTQKENTKLEKKNLEKINIVLFSCSAVLGIPKSHIHLKVHEKKPGRTQYEARGEKRIVTQVKEGSTTFETNLSDYLDTGIFLDMRNLRQMIQKESSGKTFLNLFAYTCTASVSAALGGASKTTSVDLSNTYLEWGKRNFKLNGIPSETHEFIKSDCLRFITQSKAKYDIILLAPPSWSRSKSMQTDFVIERDYKELIQNTVALLKPNGTLFFVSHAKSLHFDTENLRSMKAEEITEKTCPFDFEKQTKPHQTWKLTHKA